MKNRKTAPALYVTIILSFVTITSALYAGTTKMRQDCESSTEGRGMPVSVSGRVISVGLPGNNMIVDTGAGLMKISGLGPLKFWKEEGIVPPSTGDLVLIHGYRVTGPDGSNRIIAADITVRDKTIVLRNPETGTPAWLLDSRNTRRGTCGSINHQNEEDKENLQDGCDPR